MHYVGGVLCISVLPISRALLFACFLHCSTFLCPPTEAAIYWFKKM